MKLVAAVTPNMPLVITEIDAIAQVSYGLEDVLKNGLTFVVIALGTDEDGAIYLLIVHENRFIWLPQKKCKVGVRIVQQSPLTLPGNSRVGRR